MRRRDAGDAQAADDFIDFLWLSPEQHGNALRRLAMLTVIHRPHGWMYDADSMSQRLRDVGFVDVVERGFREGECPDVERIETRPKSFFLEAKRA